MFPRAVPAIPIATGCRHINNEFHEAHAFPANSQYRILQSIQNRQLQLVVLPMELPLNRTSTSDLWYRHTVGFFSARVALLSPPIPFFNDYDSTCCSIRDSTPVRAKFRVTGSSPEGLMIRIWIPRKILWTWTSDKPHWEITNQIAPFYMQMWTSPRVPQFFIHFSDFTHQIFTSELYHQIASEMWRHKQQWATPFIVDKKGFRVQKGFETFLDRMWVLQMEPWLVGFHVLIIDATPCGLCSPTPYLLCW